MLLFLPVFKKKPDENIEEPTMIISKPDPSLHDQLSQHLPIQEDLKRQAEEEKLWFYLDKDHHQVGPVSIIALRELWNTGRLELTSYVWSEGMDQWEKVDKLPELKVVLNKS